MKTQLRFNSYQRFLVIALTILQFTIVLDFMVLSPLGAILMKELLLSTSEFGTVVSAYAFSAGIAGLLAAGFADRFDRKRLLLFFYCGFIIGTACCALAYDYTTLLAARIFTGLFGGVIGSISMAILTDTFPLEQRGRVLGIVQMAFASSQIMGVPLGIWCANQWGWQSSFWLIVAFSVVLLALLFQFMRPVNAHLNSPITHSPVQHLVQTISNRRYLTGFSAICLLSIGGYMLQPFGSAYMVNNLKIEQTELPLVYFFTGIIVMIIMPIIGKLSDKIEKIRLFHIGSIIALIAVIYYTHLGPTPLWHIVVFNMFLFSGIMSRVVPAQALNSAIPELSDRGAYMSINSSMQQIAGGIGAYFSGKIVYQSEPEAPLENYSLLGFIIAAMILITMYQMIKVDRIVKAKLAD